MSTESFSEICANIKACLNSSKRQTSINELNRDYKSVLGEPIPYRALGYGTLEKLIRAVPDLKITNVGSDLFIDVKPDEKTRHITDLVRGQRSAAPKKKWKGSRYGKSVYNEPRRRAPPPLRKSYSPAGRSNSYSKPSTRYSSRSDHDRQQDEDMKNDSRYFQRKFTSSVPSQFDFSDGDDDLLDDFDGFLSDEYTETSPTKFDSDLCSRVNKLQVTLGNSGINRKVCVDKYAQQFTKGSSVGGSKSNSFDDDVGYVSMNEVTSFGARNNNDKESASRSKKVSSKRTPAAIAAAGKAMIEPQVPQMTESGYPQTVRYPFSHGTQLNVIDDLLYNHPPKPVVKRETSKRTMKTELERLLSQGKKTMDCDLDSLLKDNNRSTQLPTIAPINKTTFPRPLSSKMSDPNMFKPGPDLPPRCAEGSSCKQLFNFMEKHKLPAPVFKNFTKHDPRTNSVSYMCNVKLWDDTATSFPFDSSNLNEVQEHVAKKAFETLKRRYENANSIALPVASDKQKIISRIAQIVNPHSNGLKSSSIESKYKSLYQEVLPSNWLSIIKDLSLLSVEELVGGICVYPIPCEGLNSCSSVTTLPPLILPESDDWDIFVTCCSSTSCVHFRIVHDDYNGRYEAMAERMEELYSEKKPPMKPIDIIKEANFYAALLDKVWYRVKVLSGVDKNNKVRVSLIDHGDVDEVNKDCIFPLEEELTDLPPQAVRGRLTDLEQYCNHSYLSKYLYELICGKSVVAHIDARNPQLSLTLFDTSTNDDIKLNEFIKEKIEKELAPPKLPSKNVLADVHLTSVLEDGSAYIQIISESLKFLNSLLAEANQELLKNEKPYVIKSAADLIGGKIFLVRYVEDNRWHRGLVTSLTNDREAEVAFIDYGNVEVVSLDNIADIHHRFNDALEVIPPQAVQVQLVKPTNELFTQSIIEFLMGLALPRAETDELARVFVMKLLKDKEIPDVELFVRLTDNNKLVPVNDILGSYYPEYRSKSFTGVKLSSVNSILSKKSGGPKKGMHDILEKKQIRPYQFPKNEAFYVYVAMVSHPGLFVVYPQEWRAKVQHLKEEMDAFYEKEQPSINLDELKPGQACAVKRESDNSWCRGLVICVMQDCYSVSVRLVDYGQIVSVKYHDMLQLLPYFRELPSMAIRAELDGIKPLDNEWNINDCLRFRELTDQKVLISMLIDQCEDKVRLVLYDDNGNVDISALLIAENRARDITKTEHV